MKIISRLSLWKKVLISQNTSLFSNLLKNKPLQMQDLIKKNIQEFNQEFQASKPFAVELKLNLAKMNALFQPKNKKLEKQQSVLNRMEQSLSNNIEQMHQKSLCFNKSLTDAQKLKQNSLSFMQILDHSLNKQHIIEVIQTIQAYVETKQKYIQFSSLNQQKMIKDLSQSEYKFFGELRMMLTNMLNYYQQNISVNTSLIDFLLHLLSQSDPSYINVINLERQSISETDNFINQGRNYFGINFIKQNTTSQSHSPPQQKVITSEDKYKNALQQALLLKDRAKFIKIYMNKSNLVSEQPEENNKKLNLANKNVILRKINIQQRDVRKHESDLTSAYCYQLPFNITQAEAEQFIKFLEKTRNITIQSFVLFSYKSFLQKQHHDIIFRVPQRYQEENLPIEKQYRKITIDQLTKIERVKARESKKIKIMKNQFADVPLENSPKKLVTEALLLKIKKETYSKFNKSSMIINFASAKDKQAVFSQDSRLYGLNYKNFRNVKFEEGYCKTTINLTNIPWGCTSKQLEQQINTVLQTEKISVKLVQNVILTKSYVFLQFQYLSEALLAIKKLNNFMFHNKKLKAHLAYGPCKVFKNKYDPEIQDSYYNLKQKIEQQSAHHLKRYQQQDK